MKNATTSGMYQEFSFGYAPADIQNPYLRVSLIK